MALTNALIEVLKREIKSRDNYAAVAKHRDLSEASMHLADRLKRAAQAFRHAHHEDLKLPLDQRPVMSILLAMRQREPGAFRNLRRKATKL